METVEFSQTAFNEYVQSKQKRRQLTFPFCKRCREPNNVPELMLCKVCALDNYTAYFDNDFWRARKAVENLRSNPSPIYVMYTPGVIETLSIMDGRRRFSAVKNYGIKKGYTENNFLMVLVDELDGRLIDRSKRGNMLYEVDMFQPNNAKILLYRDLSTGEIYADTSDTDIHNADEAMAWKFWCTEEEYEGLEGYEA